LSWPNIDLQGKRILVTGASSGMGAAVAVACGEAGADVALVGRDEARLGAVAERAGANGSRALELVADLAVDGVPEQLVADAIADLGGLDGLVNAAGVFTPEPFLEGGLANLDLHWGVNIRGPFALALAAVPHLRGGGSMVLFSSIGGIVGFPGCAGYGATKGAIEMLVRTLAVEEGPNDLRVNGIAPGWIRTPMNDHIFAVPEQAREAIESSPMKRVGSVDDVAPTVAFLLSDFAGYISGQTICIDGGTVAG
jgi:glucose 1-dehydrogenase